MLGVIVTKEIRDLIGSTTFVVTFGVCAILILLSFYVGAMNYKLAVAHDKAARAENLRQMEGLTDWANLEQHRIFLPPQPLEALVTGISNDIGRTIELRRRGEIVAEGSRFNEDPIYAAFRFLDLNFVFQIVVSLFAILLGYNTISGEKENGTLRLVFANAVPRATYILGKLVGSFTALSAALVAAIGFGCCLLPLLGVHLNGDEWLRLAIIVLAGLLYFGAFLTLAIFVSSITQRTSSSFVILLVVWIMSVMIVPRASVLLAGRAVDVPTVDELGAQKGSFNRQVWREFTDELSSYSSPPPEEEGGMEAMMNDFHQFMDSATIRRDSKVEAFANQLNEQRYNRQKVQERFAFSIARISPTASLSFASAKLAGTSLDLKNRYRAAAAEYRQKYDTFMKEKTGMAGRGRMVKITVGEDEEPPEPIDPREIPAFQYRAATFTESVLAAAIDLGALAFFNIVFFAGAFIGFLRYDLR